MLSETFGIDQHSKFLIKDGSIKMSSNDVYFHVISPRMTDVID